MTGWLKRLFTSKAAAKRAEEEAMEKRIAAAHLESLARSKRRAPLPSSIKARATPVPSPAPSQDIMPAIALYGLMNTGNPSFASLAVASAPEPEPFRSGGGGDYGGGGASASWDSGSSSCSSSSSSSSDSSSSSSSCDSGSSSSGSSD